MSFLEENEDKILDEKTEKENLYNEWCDSYDEDLDDQNYVAPRVISEILLKCMKSIERKGSDSEIRCLDLGCGTGLVGMSLRKIVKDKDLSYILDGCDISEGMLEVARKKKNSYRKLFKADLRKSSLNLKENSYDILVSCGCFVSGHLGKADLKAIIDFFTRGNKETETVFLISTRESFTKTQKFEDFVKALPNLKEWEVQRNAPYHDLSKADYWTITIGPFVGLKKK